MSCQGWAPWARGPAVEPRWPRSEGVLTRVALSVRVAVNVGGGHVMLPRHPPAPGTEPAPPARPVPAAGDQALASSAVAP